MKKFILIPLAIVLSSCSIFELTVERKDYVPAYIEYVDCRGLPDCGGDGFIQVQMPECWRLVFDDLGVEQYNCVPKKVWDNTVDGEIWYSNSMQEKSR